MGFVAGVAVALRSRLSRAPKNQPDLSRSRRLAWAVPDEATNYTTIKKRPNTDQPGHRKLLIKKMLHGVIYLLRGRDLPQGPYILRPGPDITLRGQHLSVQVQAAADSRKCGCRIDLETQCGDSIHEKL